MKILSTSHCVSKSNDCETAPMIMGAIGKGVLIDDWVAGGGRDAAVTASCCSFLDLGLDSREHVCNFKQGTVDFA